MNTTFAGLTLIAEDHTGSTVYVGIDQSSGGYPYSRDTPEVWAESHRERLDRYVLLSFRPFQNMRVMNVVTTVTLTGVHA